MRRLASPVLRLLVIAGATLYSLSSGSAQTQVVGQDLTKLRAEGKVDSVMWTRRADHYSLQVVFPKRTSPPAAPAASAPTTPALAYPDVRVWLLRKDGTTIAPMRRQAVSPDGSRIPMARGAPDRVARVEVTYAFPLSAGEEAVAVAMDVDGVHRIEPLQPL